MNKANAAIDAISAQCLNKDSWRELEVMKDTRGDFRSIILGYELTQEEMKTVINYFNEGSLLLEMRIEKVKGEKRVDDSAITMVFIRKKANVSKK